MENVVFKVQQPGDSREENGGSDQNDSAHLPVLVARLQHVQDAQRLLFGVSRAARVLNHKVGLLALVFERHLRGDTLFGVGLGELVAVHQSGQLNVLLAVRGGKWYVDNTYILSWYIIFGSFCC